MVEPLTVAVVAAGGYGAARSLASYAARTYRPPTDGPGRPPMRRVWAQTADGWRLSADHHRPAGDPRGTVVLCHGLGINRAFFDVTPTTSLARHLARDGFEVFNVDLRGGGDAVWMGPGRPPTWNFDTHVRHDVPAVVQMALEHGAHDRVHWIGHSMGGMVLLGWLGLQSDDARIASGMVIGSPVAFADTHWSARVVTTTWKQLGRVVQPPSSVFPFMAPLMPAIRFRTHLLDFGNFEGLVLRSMLYRTYERIHPRLLNQFAAFFSRDRWVGEGGVDYRARLSAITTPMAFMVGAADRVAPPSSVEAGFRRVRSPITRFDVIGRETGYAMDYCHGGVINGRTAPTEVYPMIGRWLAERAG